jgi:hypothetical protein
MHEGRMQTERRTAYAGSRLKLADDTGRRRLKGLPSSRTGENPPYGMIGGIEETSASYEARSAPRSYPTGGCALEAHETMSPEMATAVKPSRQPRTESCVEFGNGPCEA